MEERKEREAEKRKLRQNDGDDGGAPKRAREDNGERTAATDEEVDEFFAIIRRIHAAVNYFKKTNGEGRNLRETVALELETTNVENNDVKDDTKRVAKDVEQNRGLDLNADPVSDPEPI